MHADRAHAQDLPSPSELAELPEVQAQGEMARVYADIRATLRVDLVNLIYRHLATLPDALPWAWGCLRPHFASGALHEQAARLRSEVARSVAAWPPALGDLPAQSGAARLAATYTQANSLNLMAMTHLLVMPRVTLREPGRVHTAVPATAAAPASLESLPPLPAWSALPHEEVQRVLRLNRLGESGEPQIVASLYRHLAAWPRLLAQVEPALLRLQRTHELARALDFTVQAAQGIARDEPLSLGAAPPPAFDPATRQRLLAFATVTIPKMVPIGLALQRAFSREAAGPAPS